ncbi:hypothetical protein VOLCADRAFT_115992, partial [Volvox carteri f. nagariensis]
SSSSRVWVPQHHRDITLGRLDGYLAADGQFSDRTIRADMWSRKCAECVSLEVYSHPRGIPYPTYDEAIRMPYCPAKVGDSFGPSWTTHWFRVRARVPPDWDGLGPLMFRWDSGSEAMLYTEGPTPRQGITDQRNEYQLGEWAVGGQELLFYVEMAANGMFGNGPSTNNIQPPDENRYFTLKTAELAIPNLPVVALFHDLRALTGLAKELPAGNATGEIALYTANKIVNTYFQGAPPECVSVCRSLAAEVLAVRDPGERLQVYAVGHCHIDTAWLWPFSETHRKTARSWSSQLRLAERYPWHVFTASSAQQYEWLLQDYPGLFSEIQEAAARGTFVPVGGTWVEMDTNLPSGESLIRQFLYGQRFFEAHFGSRCDVFWLPDTFGYSGQLPQIARGAGIRYFLTQKLSWNNINTFPHSTFQWAGLDGSSLLTHFPPANTYNAQADAHDILLTATNSKDKDRAPAGYMLYGNGDGGGGPTVDMCESLSRLAGCRGLESLTVASPSERGELYFELHRGTYTSHAANKSHNRSCELLLREAEAAGALAAAVLPADVYCYPRSEIDAIWKDVLLFQFHDVLPGSSIGQVYDYTAERYPILEFNIRKIRDAALEALLAAAGGATATAAVGATVPCGSSSCNDSNYYCVGGGGGGGGVGTLHSAEVVGARPLNPHVCHSAPSPYNNPLSVAQDCYVVPRAGGQVSAIARALARIVSCGHCWRRCGSQRCTAGSGRPPPPPPPAQHQSHYRQGAEGETEGGRGALPRVVTAAAAAAAAAAAPVTGSGGFSPGTVVGAAARVRTTVGWVYNSMAFHRREVVSVPVEMLPPGVSVRQLSADRTAALVVVDVPPLSLTPLLQQDLAAGYGSAAPALAPAPSAPACGGRDDAPWVGGGATILRETTRKDGVVYVMQNSLIRAMFDSCGRLISLYDMIWQRELVPEGEAGNVFRLYEDIPLYWDAWDIEIYHLEKGYPAGQGLPPPKVEWSENRTALKVEFPWLLDAPNASYEVQFGAVQRPTHTNTSWDWARFEVCAHKWADLSEPGYGIALLNDCKYGHATHGNIMRLTLLRRREWWRSGWAFNGPLRVVGPPQPPSPRKPHPAAARAVLAAAGGYDPSQPMFCATPRHLYTMSPSPSPSPSPAHSYSPLCTPATTNTTNTITCSLTSPVASSVARGARAPADEPPGALVVRLYEPHGGRGVARVRWPAWLRVSHVALCNLLEEDQGGVEGEGEGAEGGDGSGGKAGLLVVRWDGAGGSVDIEYGPFKVITLKLYLEQELVVDDSGQPEAYEINYITFYAFNGHYHIPANVPLFRTGHHVGDWEHLTVRLDATSLELQVEPGAGPCTQGVWYNAHRNIEGEWVPGVAVPRTPCGRILGFVAINGHGIYPKCGTIHRLFFIVNDRTSRRGPVWAPTRLVRLCGLEFLKVVEVLVLVLCYKVQSLFLPTIGGKLDDRRFMRMKLIDESLKAWKLGLEGMPSSQRITMLELAFPNMGVQIITEQHLRVIPGVAPGQDGGYYFCSSHKHQIVRLLFNSDGMLWESWSGLEFSTTLTQLDAGWSSRSGFMKESRMYAALLTSSLLPMVSRNRLCTSSHNTRPPSHEELLDGIAQHAGVGAEEGPHQHILCSLQRTLPHGNMFLPCPSQQHTQQVPQHGRSAFLQMQHNTTQRYRGRWGSVVSPTLQGWFLNAEPPVSRGCLRRLFLPLARGVERLEPACCVTSDFSFLGGQVDPDIDPPGGVHDG